MMCGAYFSEVAGRQRTQQDLLRRTCLRARDPVAEEMAEGMASASTSHGVLVGR